MTDLEMTKLCAEAMDVAMITGNTIWSSDYDPLHDDAQAMAMVKKFRLSIISGIEGGYKVMQWRGDLIHKNAGYIYMTDLDLNRAIVECVAKMQTEKGK